MRARAHSQDRANGDLVSPVTIVVLTHIPFSSGYHKYKLDVLKLCLRSIHQYTATPYRLLVFDNGSGEQAKRFLQQELERGSIDTLLRSECNIGKIGAFQIIFPAVKSRVVAYFDDDVFVYPGWLKAHLEILETFPQVGMVSGAAIRERFTHAVTSDLQFAAEHEDVALERGRFLPEQTERDFVESTGRWWPKYQAETAHIEDLRLRYKGISAFATANHFQFVSPTASISRALPAEWSGRLMGQMRELDERMDELGFLRLSTASRCVRHLGNQLTPEYRSLVEPLGLRMIIRSRPALEVFMRRVLVKIPGVKRLNFQANRWLYNRMNSERQGRMKPDSIGQGMGAER